MSDKPAFRSGDIRNPKVDTREQLGWWAPGAYICQCKRCGDFYVGDKRSLSCADCEYNKDGQ